MPAKKKDFWSGKSISRICSETLLKSLINSSKLIINDQLNIILGQFTEEELDTLLKKIKNRKAADFDKIPPSVCKTRKFDNIFLQLCNTDNKQNTIEKWSKGCVLLFSKKANRRITKNYRVTNPIGIAAFQSYPTWNQNGF